MNSYRAPVQRDSGELSTVGRRAVTGNGNERVISMKISQLLSERSAEIIERAARGIRSGRLEHYRSAGDTEVRARLEALHQVTSECIARRDLQPMIAHAERIAKERFTSGYGLQEIQAAFNTMEEAIWHQAVEDLGADDLHEALVMVSTALGTGKDVIARVYVSLATHMRVPSLNVEELFKGTGPQ